MKKLFNKINEKPRLKKCLKILYYLVLILNILWYLLLNICFVVGAVSGVMADQEAEVKSRDNKPVSNIVECYGEYRMWTFADFTSNLKLKAIITRLYDITDKQWGDTLTYQANVSNASCRVGSIGTFYSHNYYFPDFFGSGNTYAPYGVTNVNFYISDSTGATDWLRLDIDFYYNNDILYRIRCEYNSNSISANGGTLGYYTIAPLDMLNVTYYKYVGSITEQNWCLFMQYSGSYNLYTILTYAFNDDTESYQNGFDAGYLNGYSSGYSVGEEVGNNDGFDRGRDTGYSEGYNVGYNAGLEDGEEGYTSIFTLIGNAFTAVANVLNIELLPHLSIGTLVFAPLLIAVIIVIVKLVRG